VNNRRTSWSWSHGANDDRLCCVGVSVPTEWLERGVEGVDGMIGVETRRENFSKFLAIDGRIVTSKKDEIKGVHTNGGRTNEKESYRLEQTVAPLSIAMIKPEHVSPTAKPAAIGYPIFSQIAGLIIAI